MRGWPRHRASPASRRCASTRSSRAAMGFTRVRPASRSRGRADEGARAISTGLGYNQLLTANSVEVLAENGHTILAALKAQAAALQGPARAALEKKIAIVHRMYEFCRSVPNEWGEHVKLGD